MLADRYVEAALRTIEQIRDTQSEPIANAARLIADVAMGGHRTFVVGSGHSNTLTQELCLRAGGLPIFNPIYIQGLLPTDFPYLRGGLMERVPGIAGAVLESSAARNGDAMIVISNSGRNSVPIELALEAKARGLQVVALTSVGFSGQVTARHPCGKRLYEIADIVIDNCTPYGDAAVEVDGSPARIGPLSTVAGSLIVHMLACGVCDELTARGKPAPVFSSGNVDGADEHDLAILREYSHLITYE